MAMTIFLSCLVYLGAAMCMMGLALHEMPGWLSMDRKMRKDALLTALLVGVVWPAVAAMYASNRLSDLSAWLRKPKPRPNKVRPLKKLGWLVLMLLGGSAANAGHLLTYTWTENGVVVATGVRPTFSAEEGIHTYILEVCDAGGLCDTDDVVVTIIKCKGNSSAWKCTKQKGKKD